MNAGPQFLPPRQSVIFAITRKMLDKSGLCVRKFAMQVAENYFNTTALDCRTLPLKWGFTTDDLIKAEKHNAQIIGRYMDGTVKTLPCDLEDAWVSALLPEYRADCERDLATRRGMLSLEYPQFNGLSKAADVAGLAKEFGELLCALAPALVDGVLDEADATHAQKILRESDDLVAQVMGIRIAVSDVLLRAKINKAMSKGMRNA